MSDDRLSLTLEEIVHIRSVLTKAELEVLPVEGRVKEDVEKRRVCFLCLKTRFGIFGPWGQKCKLCKKTVCQKCCSKMRIPTEHFAHVPVVLLSPSLLPSPEDEHSSFPRSLMSRLVSPDHASMVENSVGSAPSSPASVRRHAAHAHSAPGSRGGSALGFSEAPASAAMSRSIDGPGSMPLHLAPVDRRWVVAQGQSAPVHEASAPGSRGGSALDFSVTRDRFKHKVLLMQTLYKFVKSSLHLSCLLRYIFLPSRVRYTRGTCGAAAAERLRGVQMAVCHDCKAMVLQIIKSSRAARSASRDRALRHLTLDLAPVYTADC
ncbi:hypothetical protein ABMA28_013838 [Loxostege sticticalis]|uniref:Protein spire n=1 Tax=Loxostege sticticalis TaxID=481309 RepID=A0ABD0TK33_LOXSC